MLKNILGLSTCRGCVFRRLGGLYCGCRNWIILRPSAWKKYGCWHYVDARMIMERTKKA